MEQLNVRGPGGGAPVPSRHRGGPRQGEVFTLEKPQAFIGRADGAMDAEIEIEDHGEFRVGRTRFMLILADPE